jgi:hypothetical protein
MSIWRVRIACRITKATNTQSLRVIRDSMLHHTYIACLVTTRTECVYCAVRTESLTIIQISFFIKVSDDGVTNLANCQPVSGNGNRPF